MNDKMSFLLTSCGRLDLLDRTLASFFKFNNFPLEELYLTEDSANQDVYNQINKKWGKLDLFVSNAAITAELTPLSHLKPDVWDKVINLNLTTNFR